MIRRIEKIIKKKTKKSNKFVNILFGAYLNQIFKILNNGCRQSLPVSINYKCKAIEKERQN